MIHTHTKRSDVLEYFYSTEIITNHESQNAYRFVAELANNIRAAAQIDILRRSAELHPEAMATLWNAKEYLQLKIERMVKDEPFLLGYLIEYSKGYFEENGCNRS